MSSDEQVPSSSSAAAARAKRSTPNWKSTDVDLMLTQVAHVLPCGSGEWETGTLTSHIIP